MNLTAVVHKLIDVTNMESKEIIVLLISLFLFIWLYKEFKSQYNKKIDIKSANSSKMRIYISRSLSLANQYKIDPTKAQDFFVSIFTCYPLMKPSEIKYTQGIIEDISLEDIEKIEKIERNLYQKLIYLSNDNKDSSDVKYIIGWIEYIFIRLKHLFGPVIYTILTFSGLIISLGIVSSIDGNYIRFLIFSMILVIIITLSAAIDLLIKRKTKSSNS